MAIQMNPVAMAAVSERRAPRFGNALEAQERERQAMTARVMEDPVQASLVETAEMLASRVNAVLPQVEPTATLKFVRPLLPRNVHVMLADGAYGHYALEYPTRQYGVNPSNNPAVGALLDTFGAGTYKPRNIGLAEYRTLNGYVVKG